MDKIFDVINEWIEKYSIADEDVAELEAVINGVSEEELYGDEFQDDIAKDEE